MPQAWLAVPQAWLAGPQIWLAGPHRLIENLPILQDFAPYQGRCPASPHETKEKVEQGKGTADPSLIYSHILSYFCPHLFQTKKNLFFFLAQMFKRSNSKNGKLLTNYFP